MSQQPTYDELVAALRDLVSLNQAITDMTVNGEPAFRAITGPSLDAFRDARALLARIDGASCDDAPETKGANNAGATTERLPSPEVDAG